jgi:hypothetical protein
MEIVQTTLILMSFNQYLHGKTVKILDWIILLRKIISFTLDNLKCHTE